ncbi:MAG: DeoR/GlpR family DNA-binding transcription regulator [Synergistaceae bacterium]|nr:DeoR/GlpR family DNA-binding transcription regulator [Synergistaceae bacterium]
MDLLDVKMGYSRLGINIRRKKIIQILKAKGFVLASELSAALRIGEATIQKDFEIMEEAGQIERFCNGAILLADDKRNALGASLTLYKHAIAMRAAQCVEQGDAIFVNSSSTALLMLPYIEARHVTVVTNNTRAIGIKRRDDMTVILTGGEVWPPENMLVGKLTLDDVERFAASKSFLGCSGITAKRGITTAILREAAINELMLTKTTGKRFILADRTKVGRTSSFTCGMCDQISCLITDAMASKGEVAKLRKRIEVVQVDAPTRPDLGGDE